jgi:heme exporter protein B
MINDPADIKKFGVIFSVIFLPIALISFSSQIFNCDLDDGNLELLLASCTETEIIIPKFLAILICSITSSILNMPIIYIIFDLDIVSLSYLFLALIILLTLSTALLILIAAIQSYFRSNANLIALLIMPLLTPSIILTGLIIQDHQKLNLISVIIGINLLLLPIILYLSSYLIKNIYNI